jgi:hypothetical protein
VVCQVDGLIRLYAFQQLKFAGSARTRLRRGELYSGLLTAQNHRSG